MENTNHLALYRKWRPQNFDEVCGQEHIVNVLKYETANGHLTHAYLFCGSRGTGKTSCAKILAKAVNCEHPKDGNPCGECAACRAIDAGTTTDVLEMDAASNNGVDNIRDIRDEVNFAPADLKYRVYIIDEVHMLSASAFNALLKTLEEPPAHVIFILATTELQKLPATIISRCQRFDFRRISIDDLISRLKYIAKEENIELEPDAAHLLARLAQGGMRDAISLLELCSGGGRRVTVETVNEAVGSVGRENVLRTVKAVADADYDAIFGVVAEAVSSSKDLTVFWQELISLYRDMLIIKTTPDSSRYLDLTDAETAQLGEAASRFTKETLLSHCRLLDGALLSMQRSNAVKRTIAELTLIRMSDQTLDTSNEALLARIARLEDMVRRGTVNIVSTSQPADVADVSSENAPPVKVAEQTSPEETSEAPEKTSLSEPTRISEPVPTQKSEKTGNADTSGKRVLRTMRGWVEVNARIAREKQSLAALLNGSRAYTDEDGRIVLRLPSTFALGMIERGRSKDTIIEALSSELGRVIRENEVLFEAIPPESGAPDDTIFDEIDELNGEEN